MRLAHFSHALRRGLSRLGAAALLLPALGQAQDCPTPPAPLSKPQLQAAAADRGLLWQLQRDGRTSYLYATLHVGKASWAAPGPQLRQALQAVQRVALEIDPHSPEMQSPPSTAAVTLAPALQQRLRQQLRRACLPEVLLQHMHPSLLLASLSAFEARRAGMDASFGSELMLAQWARDNNRPVLSLERAQEQLQALIPSDPRQRDAELDEGLQAMEDGSAMRQLQALVSAWERGDLATLSNPQRWCHCSADAAALSLLRRLNDGRNPALAQRIEQLHQQGPVLAAVGALHMTGSAALPTLLRARGFELRRLWPPETRP
ncbi:TraB/GumN family protein [Roseateles sp. BYS180W]|uniref:TraB/GumN family protein n=1 Tax=Roseateles rivi TaxID=3299028 RepID=A0ABW7FQP1_9BURK